MIVNGTKYVYRIEIDTMEDVMELVTRKATKYNFGMYRSWESDGVMYFDCGPTVYAVKKIEG